ncbi:S8 family serine peptidase [Micromonospora echinofusca]|uniref:S8 family serine peptidase n=1 Tax=Micromonospora echinofusca TaxID=47858 RepID=A0ABS3VRY8_MICEH|nr:S8 family serine peptidase [Micromonospora echinofusca]MBO4207310.1 S8 family serine peptidase [Micromonospora echinofusca]
MKPHRQVHRLATAGVAGAVVWLTCPAAAPAAAALRAPTGCLPPATTVVAEPPWAQARLAPAGVWHLTRGAGQTVAVVDSGVAAGVRQLSGAVLPGVPVGSGVGAANQDCLGSGTFTAGIIAARPAADVAFVGVAPAATILPVRIAGTRWPDNPRVLDAAIRRAVDRGARVVCVAVPLFDASAQLRAAVAYAAARDVLVVVLAPTDEPDRAVPDEQVLRHVLTVGAVDPSGAPVGANRPGTVDLVAPGADVTSLGPGGPGHLVRSGGEAAVPFVAGTAALVRAYHPGLTAAQVKHRLLRTADRPGTALPDPRLGWGTVNPYTAVTMVLPEENVTPAPTVPAAAPTVPPLRRERPDRAATTAALVTVGTATGLTVVLVTVAAAVRHGRARRPQDTGQTV